MGYFRVSTASANVTLGDLGITLAHPAVNIVLSDQFSVHDLANSDDLATEIAAGNLTAERYNDGSWTAIAAVDYDPKDIFGAFQDTYEIVNESTNQKLVDGSDVDTLHMHDGRYYTETEMGDTANGSSGAGLVGVDETNFSVISGDDVQAALDSIDDSLNGSGSVVTLDNAYQNDADGRLDVDGGGDSKDLDFRSDNTHKVIISRTDTTNIQQMLVTDLAGDELELGAAAAGALGQVNVRVKTNLIIDGDITYTGTITDTTVDKLDVTNAEILLRQGATTGADSYVKVERGSTGADAALKWNETTDRWQAGVVGSEETIALLERDEVVSGVYEMQGGGATEPSVYLTEKAAAPSANLGTASQIPMAMMQEGILAVYDKSNSRNKFLSVDRIRMRFSGRNHANNSNEYARFGEFTSNLSSEKLLRNATLVGISADTNGAETWTAQVRKNGAAANLAALAMTAEDGKIDKTLNVNFEAGDIVQVYIDGTGVNRPFITLEFAYRF